MPYIVDGDNPGFPDSNYQGLAVLDSTGAIRWMDAVTGDGPSWRGGVDSVAADALGNVYVLTSTTPRRNDDLGVSLSSFSPEGVLRWGQRIGEGLTLHSSGLSLDSSNNVYVVAQGLRTFPVSFGILRDFPVMGEGGNIVASMTSEGAHRWTMAFVSTPDQVGFNAAGDGVVIGKFSGNLDAWLGTAPVRAESPSDVFALGITQSGRVRWARRIGGVGTGQTRAYEVALDPSGGALAVGQYSGGRLGIGADTLNCTSGPTVLCQFAFRLDPLGSPRWARGYEFQLGSPDTVRGLATEASYDTSGNATIAGTFSGTANLAGFMVSTPPSRARFVTTFSATGTPGAPQLSRIPNDPAWQFVSAAPVPGGWIVAGSFAGTITIGGTTLVSRGAQDVFVARVGP